jgi:hypothetical protein
MDLRLGGGTAVTMRERALLERLRGEGSLKRVPFLSKDLIALEVLCNAGLATWDRESDLILPARALSNPDDRQAVLL